MSGRGAKLTVGIAALVAGTVVAGAVLVPVLRDRTSGRAIETSVPSALSSPATSEHVVTTSTATTVALTPATNDAGTAIIVTATPAATATSATTATTATSIEPVTAGDDAVGISLGHDALESSDTALGRDLASVYRSGARWIRVDVDWSHIEAQRGAYDWTATDRVVAAATAKHLNILGLIAYTPAWARADGTTDKHPPLDTADFARFAGAAATHYLSVGGVNAWEVWNEPNLARFWAPRPDARAYSALLVDASLAIRHASPSSTVITGGLSPAVNARDRSEIAPERFLRTMLDAGAGDSFDAVGAHPYSYPALPSDETTSSWNSFQRLPLLRAQLTRVGMNDRPIWITEIGAPTGTSRRAVDEERQAEIVVDAIHAARQLPWIGRVFVFNERDSAPDPSDAEVNFGLRRFDDTPKLAWDAFAAALKQ